MISIEFLVLCSTKKTQLKSQFVVKFEFYFSMGGIQFSCLYVGVFDTCLALHLLVLPSETHAAANMIS